MSANRAHFSAVAHLLGMAAAAGAFDDYTPPAVVPADPLHPGPHNGDCCYANHMISPETHNADCPSANGGES